ncbi:MAG TPA: hypothetical protein VND91_03910 [Candidatus Saccharimonadia bacterium]|nr:hypothetical protein [Candidatus Saccharimonadia bacterium]
MRSLFLLVALLLSTAPHAAERSYDVHYLAEFLPAQKAVRVTITLEHDTGRATSLDFVMPAARYADVTADGTMSRDGDRVRWVPPKAGGRFSYTYRIDSQRSDDSYDARITDDWAILRGDDLFPSAKVRTTKDTDSRARLHIRLPPGWTGYETPYVRSKEEPHYVIVNPKRRFDRPVGWIIAGKLGVRREWIDGTEFSVAAPRGEGMRRMDVLSLTNVVFYEMLHAFGTMPPKILIVGAGDPMFRGGLSGPRSLWLHAERPLISENSTSTLIHELTHVITRIRGHRGHDWITEGIAEFYSLELMRRVSLLSERRYRNALRFARRWSADVTSLRASDAGGKRTARAVLLLVELDREIRRKTDDRRDIDDVTQKLMEIGKVTTDDLREISERIVDGKVDALETPLLR